MPIIMAQDTLPLLELPEVVLSHIFSFLTYDDIARNRGVCQKFNETGWRLLNRGFAAAEKYQSASLKAVKALLPRRESERRKHPLAKKCDVLVAIETRLSMLSMAFSRFIESKLCCFIPGRVIDELFRVMRSLDSMREPLPSYQILQELRDVSTMAIEYFEDKIAPSLRKKEMLALTSSRGIVFDISAAAAATSKIESCKFDYSVAPRSSDLRIRNESATRFRRMQLLADQKIRKHERTIKELQATVNEQAVRLSNHEAIVNDLKRRYDELKSCISQQYPPVEKTDDEASTSAGPKHSVGDDFEEPVIKKRKVTTKVGKTSRLSN